MARTVGIGIQDFERLITENIFYVDKTDFIREWWESKDEVTLISRPRRFGKTLNLNMLNRFFSNQFAGKGNIFEGLSIWENEKYRSLQGTYPVINLSFFRDVICGSPLTSRLFTTSLKTMMRRYGACFWRAVI